MLLIDRFGTDECINRSHPNNCRMTKVKFESRDSHAIRHNERGLAVVSSDKELLQLTLATGY
jgi:hypothetical protein